VDAEELYRLPPEQFTAARDAAAKAARAGGDRAAAADLKALRRPSVAAWLVNRLVHEDRGLLDELLALGPALAQAQHEGQGEQLRRLSGQRRELVEAVTERTLARAGRGVAPAVRAEVAATLEAALADPDSAEAVRSGRLVRGLSFAGFGRVDLTGAVARAASSRPAPAERPSPRPRSGDRDERIAAAQARAHETAGALDDAVRRCEQAARDSARSEERAAEADQEEGRLRKALAEAQRVARDAHAQHASTQRGHDKAVVAVRRAQEAVEAARKELDRLRRP
jgi:hypothetical protein